MQSEFVHQARETYKGALIGDGALFVVGLFRYPLDHTFHSAHFRLAALKALPYVGADHFPVYTELQYDPEARPSGAHRRRGRRGAVRVRAAAREAWGRPARTGRRAG